MKAAESKSKEDKMAAINAAPSTEKLSVWRKLGYGLGDIYGGGSGTLISFFYLVFLTDVIQINPGLAGVVILISKFYDAVTDPFEGILSDRTRTKLGRRRPYLLAGIFLVLISFFTMFYPVSFASEMVRFAFVLVTYLFFSTVVSIVMLNYNALQAELSLDYDERTSLSSYRIFFSTVSSILCAVLPLEIIKLYPDVRTGWMVMAGSFGLFFALPFIATFLSARERPEFQKPPQPIDWKATFIAPFKVRTFVYIVLMYLFAFVAFDAVSSIVVYFIKTYLGRGGETSYVIGALTISQVIGLPFYVWLSKRTSKPTSYIIGALLAMATMACSLIVTPKAPDFAVYLIAVMMGLGSGGVVIMVYAMFPDIPDIDELVSGERREGIYAALTTFSRKLSSAFAVFIVSQLLSITGYVPPVMETVEGATKLVEQPQSDGFILALRLTFFLVPVVFMAVGVFFARKYPLDHPTHQRLKTLLTAQRVEKSETAEMAEERQELTKILVRGG
jgi:oligogalacturonide transporter